MSETGTAEARVAGGRGATLAKLAAAALAFALLIWLGRETGAYLPQFAEWVKGLGIWGPVIFMVVYALAVVLWIPGSVLTLAAGAIFDLLPGTLYVFIAATVGSTLAFLVARYAARGAIEQRLARSDRFAAVDRAIGGQGLKIVFLLRLSPVFPFTPMNFLLGLTRVNFRDYVMASVGMIPGTLLYVYYGKLVGDVVQVAGGVAPERGPAEWALLAVGLVATIAVTMVITRAARRALAGEIEQE
jgi:uncharacterized membrane protein YdjX (TVP38/TMEM64 family)